MTFARIHLGFICRFVKFVLLIENFIGINNLSVKNVLNFCSIKFCLLQQSLGWFGKCLNITLRKREIFMQECKKLGVLIEALFDEFEPALILHVTQIVD